MTIEIRQDTGYGLVPRHIMRDKRLSIQAKAIYSYLASFAGNSGRAYPSVNLIRNELGISKDTFYKYTKELQEKGAIEIRQERGEKGTFKRNVYYLNNTVKEPCPKKPDTVQPDTAQPDTVTWDTNSNNSNSNSINSSSSYIGAEKNSKDINEKDFKEIVSLFEQNGFGTINSMTAQYLLELEKDYGHSWLKEAIETAVLANARNLRYVEGILKNWKSKGKGVSNGSSNRESVKSNISKAKKPEFNLSEDIFG